METTPPEGFWLLALLITWLPGVLILILQIACAIHVLKTGREYWWLFLILFFPCLGSIIYFFAEILPSSRQSNNHGGFSFFSGQASKVKELKMQLLYSDTLENRLQLCNAYLEASMFEKAIPAIKYCLENGCGENTKLRISLARAQFKLEMFNEAQKTLDQIIDESDKDLIMEKQLMCARILEGKENFTKALKIYVELLKKYPGEEVRCRMGLLLLKTDQKEHAKALFNEVILRSKSAPRFYAERQRKWLKIAKRNR